jgi:protein-S-isoprenylcysteine O-methyltransferase Ste14
MGMTTKKKGTGNIATRMFHQLKYVIYAAPKKDPNKAQLRVGFIGGDIPIFPPLFFVLLSTGTLLGWFFSKNRMIYLPSGFWSSIPFRAVASAAMMMCCGEMTMACKTELQKAGTAADFQPVIKVCDTGPYGYSRNLMYVAATCIPLAGSVALDTAWLLYAAMGTGLYLDRIVIPAEEKLLRDEFGEAYENYCRKVPRWFRFF